MANPITSHNNVQSISESHRGSSLSPGFHNQQKLALQDGTNNDDKTGYDEEFDEEDSKSDMKSRRRKNKDLTTGGYGDDKSASRSRKPREDPRRDFVNDFFKQNLH